MPCFSVPCGCGLLLDATPGSQLHQSHVLHCHLQARCGRPAAEPALPATDPPGIPLHHPPRAPVFHSALLAKCHCSAPWRRQQQPSSLCGGTNQSCSHQSSPTLRKACACAKRDSACRFSGIPLLPGPSRTSSLSSTDFATGAEEPLTSARWDLLKPRLSPSGTHNPMPSIASRCQPRTSPIMGNQVTGASLGK